MIFPEPWLIIVGATALVARNVPRVFTAMTRSHSSTSISSIDLVSSPA